MRSLRRMRARRSGTSAAIQDGLEAVAQEFKNESELLVADQVPVEICDEHIILRENLIKQFSIRWQRKQVEWLQ